MNIVPEHFIYRIVTPSFANSTVEFWLATAPEIKYRCVISSFRTPAGTVDERKLVVFLQDKYCLYHETVCPITVAPETTP